MLKVDPSLNHIPARREHVVALFESINQPLVNIPNCGTAPTYAYILGTRNDQGVLTVFVYLIQQETGAVVIYVSEPRGLSREQYRAEEQEAVGFVESMGFLIDDVHFPTLPPHEQDAVVERAPLFRPPAPARRDTLMGGPPSADTDALFGGLSEAEGELFRRASASSNPSHMPADVVPGSKLEGPNAARSAVREGPGRLAPEARARIGRLLGLFVALFALGLGNLACRTGREENQDAQTFDNHVDLGNQQLARGLWREAVRTFNTVLDDQPTHKEALRGLGMAYLNLDHLDEAEGFYRRSVESDPKWSIPKNELAVVLMQRGACVEAQALLEQVIKDIFYPTPEFAEHNLARAMACQGDLPGAMQRLENLVTKRPNFCLGYLTLAQVSSEAKAHEVTVRACDDFATNCEQNESIRDQISPEHSAQCYLKKGMAYAEMGDVESARAAFERCDSAGPNGRECRRSLGLLPP